VTPTTTTVFGATFARNKGYGIGFHADVHLWIPILGNILAVLLIPYVGSLSDRHGRRPCLIFGALTSGIMSFGYLWAVSQQNVALAIFFSLAMWGAAYQGYNAVFPTFYPEPFPTKTRVTGMAVSKNIANLLSSMMPSCTSSSCPRARPTWCSSWRYHLRNDLRGSGHPNGHADPEG
jgi:MFS family permease